MCVMGRQHSTGHNTQEAYANVDDKTATESSEEGGPTYARSSVIDVEGSFSHMDNGAVNLLTGNAGTANWTFSAQSGELVEQICPSPQHTHVK